MIEMSQTDTCSTWPVPSRPAAISSLAALWMTCAAAMPITRAHATTLIDSSLLRPAGYRTFCSSRRSVTSRLAAISTPCPTMSTAESISEARMAIEPEA